MGCKSQRVYIDERSLDDYKKFSKYFENENNYLIAGLTLQVPIFDGWNTSAKVEKAEIELSKTEIEIAKIKEFKKKIYLGMAF